MKARHVGMAILALSLAGAGCARITTSVVERPRVDQELTGGNRGYLVGSPPPEAPRKSTRQIFQTDVELATVGEMTPWKKQQQEAPSSSTISPAPSEVSSAAKVPSWEPPAPAEGETPVSSVQPVPVKPIEPVSRVPSVPAGAAATTYTVKRGDNLEKIAAKVYGDWKQWRRIYEANKDKMSGPNRIYAGQKLIIPPAQEKARRQGDQFEDIK